MPFSGNKTQYVAVIALIVSMIIWSVSGIAIKHALVALPPFTMILMRFIPSVLLMIVIGLVRRKHSLFCLQKMERKDLPLFLIAGFCQPFLYYMLETYAYDALNSPTIAETLLSTSPLLSPIFAAIILRERITRNNIWGILISTVGVFVLTLVGAENYSIGSYWGVLLAFMAVSAAVIDSVMMRKAPLRYSALSFVFYTQVVSLLFFIPVWFVVLARRTECVDGNRLEPTLRPGFVPDGGPLVGIIPDDLCVRHGVHPLLLCAASGRSHAGERVQ